MPEPWYPEAELICVNAFRELADKVHYEGGQVRNGGTESTYTTERVHSQCPLPLNASLGNTGPAIVRATHIFRRSQKSGLLYKNLKNFKP